MDPFHCPPNSSLSWHFPTSPLHKQAYFSQGPRRTLISPKFSLMRVFVLKENKLYTQMFKNRLLCKMLTFIKSLIYIAWSQKVTFLQKRYKSYILYYRVHNQGNRAFLQGDQKTSSTAALADFGEQPPPPNLHTVKDFKT